MSYFWHTYYESNIDIRFWRPPFFQLNYRYISDELSFPNSPSTHPKTHTPIIKSCRFELKRSLASSVMVGVEGIEPTRELSHLIYSQTRLLNDIHSDIKWSGNPHQKPDSYFVLCQVRTYESPTTCLSILNIPVFVLHF